MTEKFISNSEKEIKPEEANKINKYVENLLSANLNFEKELKVKGVGGTITTLAAVKLKMEEYDSSRIENLKIKNSELEKIIKNLSSLSLEKRNEVKGLQPKRADIIIAGLIILRNILDFINSAELYVSDHDLLYGLLKEELLN
jgi:exopolyphosphatase/guanosine-5'-triphosphate,3'-diphosphate pyrophosphatase